MRVTRWLRNLAPRYPALAYVTLFIISAALCTFIQQEATFADPDSFYHVKMAQLLASRGAITEFPWLSATTLQHQFTDHHFLYHALLIPFVLVSPLAGMKVATILFASGAVVMFYWLLRRLKVRGAWWYAVFLLTVNPFLFRVNLSKAQALVMIALWIFIFLLTRRWYLGLIVWSCLYVWLYAGWPLAAVLAVIFAVITALHQQITSTGWFASWWRGRSTQHQLLSVVSVLIGLVAGIFFSPYFPGNIAFYWQQSFEIVFANQQHAIAVGAEWYPYAWNNLILAMVPLTVLFFVSVLIFGATWKKQSAHSWFFLVVMVVFTVATLRSRRYVEYLVPFAVAYCAVTISTGVTLYEKQLAKWLPMRWWWSVPIFLYICISPFIINDVAHVYDSYNHSISFWKFSESSEWLRTHTPQGSVVFHSDWDQFPILFYNNDNNYYLVGLDPTFMYGYDANLYHRWVDITTGKTKTGLSTVIPELYNAHYVFVDTKKNAAFNENLMNDSGFDRVFQDDEAAIYQVR